MLHATTVVRRDGIQGRPIVDWITLDRDGRARRRIKLRTDQGRELMIDLAEVTYLHDGDGLVVEGGVVGVRAASEPLLAITARDPLTLARIIWHLGNRHVATEITGDTVFIAPDHVLESMVVGLGGHAQPVLRPFDPERGAYAGHGHAASGGHSHG
jgi:urease accessory protein